MTTMYSTVTAKGQITLPAALRALFDIHPGQKVGISAAEDGILVERPPSIEEVRSRLQAEMRAKGTWGTTLDSREAWGAEAVRRAQS